MHLLEKMAEEIQSGWFSSYDGLPGRVDHDFNYDDSLTVTERLKRLNEEQRKEEIVNNRRAFAIARRILNNMGSNKNCVLRFSYADEGGGYNAALEHGDLFKKLPHYTISHH